MALKKVLMYLYADPQFSIKQMGEIYNGLKDGLDVSAYANPALKLPKCGKSGAALKPA